MTKIIQFPITPNILVHNHIKEIANQIDILEKNRSRHKHILYGWTGGMLFSACINIIFNIMFLLL